MGVNTLYRGGFGLLYLFIFGSSGSSLWAFLELQGAGLLFVAALRLLSAAASLVAEHGL